MGQNYKGPRGFTEKSKTPFIFYTQLLGFFQQSFLCILLQIHFAYINIDIAPAPEHFFFAYSSMYTFNQFSFSLKILEYCTYYSVPYIFLLVIYREKFNMQFCCFLYFIYKYNNGEYILSTYYVPSNILSTVRARLSLFLPGPREQAVSSLSPFYRQGQLRRGQLQCWI